MQGKECLCMKHTLLCAETSLSTVLLWALHCLLSHPPVSAQMCPFAGGILAWFNGSFLMRLHTDWGANPTRNMCRWIITQMQQEVIPLLWDYSRAGLSTLAKSQQWITSDFHLSGKVAVFWCIHHAGTPRSRCVSCQTVSQSWHVRDGGWDTGLCRSPWMRSKVKISCQKRLKKFAVAMWWCKGTEWAGGQSSKSSGYLRPPEALILSPVGVCVTAKL